MNALVCQSCNKQFDLSEIRWRCSCGGLLDIEHEGIFSISDLARRPLSLWRYREAIPVPARGDTVSFVEGFTPLLEISIDGHQVFIKQDHLFPSGSYKDRGSTVLISRLKDQGITEVVEDSSGNAGASIASYCAAAGIVCHIFIPEATSAAKLAQIERYDAKLHKVQGNRQAAAEAVWQLAQAVYYASHIWNPFFFQGTKTFAYEICEQLGWRAPDIAVLPVGNGTLVIGAYIGFDDLRKAGIIDHMPKIIAIQAENCAPLYEMFKKDLNEIPSLDVSSTQAEGIAIARPVRARQIIDMVKRTGGDFLTVSENEITASHREMGYRGFYIEPTAAATIAGLKKYLGKSSTHEIIVSTFTGHGLKK